MRFRGLLLFSFLLTIAVAPAFAQFTGGNNDGGTVAGACTSTLNGAVQFSYGSLTGSTTFCDFSTESFTMNLNNAPQEADFFWTVPPGATIVSGDGTASITVAFGNTPGNVAVTVVVPCGSQSFSMAVTNGTCAMYRGADNDGFSAGPSCSTLLDGTQTIVVKPIVGSSAFCAGSTEGYSITVDNAPSNTYYDWSVPPGSVVTQGQGTNTIIITFGSTPGNVGVNVITDCSVTSTSIPVTVGSCAMYAGGDNDGFSQGPSCSTLLDGTQTILVNPIFGTTAFCPGSAEGFSITVDNAPANTYYQWSGPPGSVITQGQGTNTVIITFGSTPGNVSVNVITDCSVTTTSVPLTAGSCAMYNGGDNDGFSQGPSCATDLNGGSVFSIAGINGSTQFCQFGNETFTANVTNPPADIYYLWSVPGDATILSGQGTPQILVQFGTSSGSVGLTITTNCQQVALAPLAVTVSSCLFYAGGNNDGFSNAALCARKLDGTTALVPGPIIGPVSSCSSSTETYSLNAQGTNVDTYFNWTVPAGATIVSGQGTSTILVAWGVTGGTLSVDVVNPCQTVNVSTTISLSSCVFYAGGNNDGFSSIQKCASNLNGGSVFVPGAITGAATSCNFSTESYSITVAGALPNTVYVWSGPAGSTVVSGQGTTSALIAFGNTSGNVSISISNECETIVVNFPVSISNCIFYSGGNNDGFSQTRLCSTNLNGSNPFVTTPITGPTTFCNFSTEQYSISIPGANAATTYVWTVPATASIVSGQGTTNILVSFGSAGGNVSVTATNECGTVVNSTLAVNAGACVMYAGGNNDGFSVTTRSNVPLPIALVSFTASVQNNTVYLSWETSSEHDNDFFVVERSNDGKVFESLLKVDGAGTSTTALKYQAVDTNPYHGTSFYRLSQVDYDGTVSYFKVVIVKIETFAEVTKLYPNPVKKDEQLHIDYFAEEDGQVRISIIDPKGIGSESQMTDVKAGVNLFEFTPNFQSAGVHIIIIRSKDKVEALRLVVL